MSDITINVKKRESTGKNANRQLRATGMIPAVVYGAGKATVSIQVDRKTLLDMLRTSGGENVIFLLHLEGTKDKRHTMIRDMDVDPLTQRIRHVDFQRVLMDQKVRVQVAIELLGTPVGVKDEAGVLDFMAREVTIECLPGNIPQNFEIDVSDLSIGDNVTVASLEIPDDVDLLEEEARVVASVAHGRVEEEEEVEDEDDLLEAAAEEPEVIGKGKQDDEEEED